MTYAVFWKYESDENGVSVICGHPGTFRPDAETAKDEAKKIHLQLGADMAKLTPISVVQMRGGDAEVDEIISLDEVYLGPDEIVFYDISELEDWTDQPWWPTLG